MSSLLVGMGEYSISRKIISSRLLSWTDVIKKKQIRLGCSSRIILTRIGRWGVEVEVESGVESEG